MKIHYLTGSRIACDTKLPENATMTIGKHLVTCQRCIKTNAYTGKVRIKPVKFQNQPELF